MNYHTFPYLHLSLITCLKENPERTGKMSTNRSFGLGKASLFVCIFVFVSLLSIEVKAATKKYQFNVSSWVVSLHK